MSFLDYAVEFAFGSGVRTAAASRVWTDVSDDLELQEGVSIRGGRPDQNSTTAPASADLTLDNPDGRYTPDLASGAYFPDVELGTPVRLTTFLPDGNLITGGEGGFEDGVGSWESDTVGGTYGAAAFDVDNTRAHDGTWSLLATWPTHGTGSYVDRPLADLLVGREYTATCWVWVPTGSPDPRLEVADGDVGSRSSTKDAWVQLSLTFTATATEHLVGVQVDSPTSGEECWIDEVMVNPGDVAAAYSDVESRSVRFTGYVDEWVPDWPAGTDTYCVTRVKASGRLAQLGEGAELQSIIETEYMLDGPVAYYPLTEPEGSLFAVERTGSDLIGMYSFYGGQGIAFGTRTGPKTDGLPAAQISPWTGSETRHKLAAYFTQDITEATVEFFVRVNPDNENASADFIGLYQTDADSGDFKVFRAIGAFGVVEVLGIEYTEYVAGVFSDVSNFALGPGIFTDGETHHVAITLLFGSPPVAELYVDGELLTTTGAASGPLESTMPTWTYLIIGDFETDSGNGVNTVAQAIVYGEVLSAERIAAHAAAGLDGFEGELAAERIVRYASYGGIEESQVVSDPGVVPLDFISTQGTAVEALLRTIETTENGILYDTRAGEIGFRDRDHRYLTTSAFTLDVAEQHLDAAGLRPTKDRNGLINDVTATSTDGQVQRRYVDAAAADLTGPKREDITVATSDLDQVYQSAAWRVNAFKAPRLRVTSLAPVDVLPLDLALRAAVRDADISTRFTVDGLPAQLGTSLDFFVEGFTETWGHESWQLEFNVSSPAAYDAVWVLDESELDDTTILAL